MGIKRVRLVGDPVLRKKCQKITEFHSTKKIVGDLRDTLEDFRTKNGFGSGIAAPQIGAPLSAIYIITKEFEGEMLNPKITKHSKETAMYWDECFSFELAFFGKVKRWTRIEVEYYDSSGSKKTVQATDEHFATLLQHEIDHLNGILFIDRLVRNGDFILSPAAWKRLGKPLRAD